ncbi:hypothetical protein [Bacteroides thetaiotaomicron]|uniref:hypothetical protein n=1 Tax=Bacteroides thetaiotaomicron TaxID=818 RepID=UPI0028F454CD|nr:hypothetical protein [Bacteroides thetaiotaomicron]WOG18351.1 hypothetical protein RJT07_14380 [Bacteroides thetaiotaomicron]
MKATRGCPVYGVLRVTSSLGGGSAGLLSQAILRSDASIFNLVRIIELFFYSIMLMCV